MEICIDSLQLFVGRECEGKGLFFDSHPSPVFLSMPHSVQIRKKMYITKIEQKSSQRLLCSYHVCKPAFSTVSSVSRSFYFIFSWRIRPFPMRYEVSAAAMAVSSPSVFSSFPHPWWLY